MPGNIETKNVKVSFNGTNVLNGIDMMFPEGKVTAIIGPSGCGKTTLLRCINRLSELTNGCKVEGGIYLDGEEICQMDPMLLRRRVGMVFQNPNPFPKSIKENVLYGVKATKLKVNHESIVRSSLESAVLWDEVKDRLNANAMELSLGQQQRLCMARTLAISPEVVLMDEPAASLDPTSTSKLESSIMAMKGGYTVVIVTHNMQQAVRIADYTAFLYLGNLVEFGETDQVFEHPKCEETKQYISGRFG